MERTSGCLERWKCFVACLFFDESQQPTCPHSRQRRRWTQGSPVLMQSSHTSVSVVVNLICFRCVQLSAIGPPSYVAPASAFCSPSHPLLAPIPLPTPGFN